MWPSFPVFLRGGFPFDKGREPLSIYILLLHTSYIQQVLSTGNQDNVNLSFLLCLLDHWAKWRWFMRQAVFFLGKIKSRAEVIQGKWTILWIIQQAIMGPLVFWNKNRFFFSCLWSDKLWCTEVYLSIFTLCKLSLWTLTEGVRHKTGLL